ncbi:MAG: Nif3-like dinuclear metal center hexameric protein [Candidatus Bathyarchaeia archaeon]
MKAWELHKHMQEVGSWVNWEKTVDTFLVGDPNTDIKGIAVSWMPTFVNLKKALESDYNLFVTHEPLYAVTVDNEGRINGGTPSVDNHLRGFLGITLSKNDVWIKKHEWLQRTGIVVYRCHDFWDDYPEIGIHGAWANWLGFTRKPVATERFYEVHEVKETTVEKLAQEILNRLKPLGQEVIQVIGDRRKRVSRIAIGTGAIVDYRKMKNLGANVLLVTDDGTRLWESGQWSLDSDVPMLIVNHSTSEEPGMKTLSLYLQKQFPNVHVKHIPTGCIYEVIK